MRYVYCSINQTLFTQSPTFDKQMCQKKRKQQYVGTVSAVHRKTSAKHLQLLGKPIPRIQHVEHVQRYI